MSRKMWWHGYRVFRCITANSNQYACEHMDQMMLCLGGSKWNNIQLEEMIHFFGVVLEMSNDDRRAGDTLNISEIFTDQAEDYSINIKGFTSWAKGVMIHCFMQIHSPFHPNPHCATSGEKCHQLCYAINKLNDIAKHTSILSIDLSLIRVVFHKYRVDSLG